MTRFEFRVDEVNGYCACGYKVGDIIRANGMETPETPFLRRGVHGAVPHANRPGGGRPVSL